MAVSRATGGPCAPQDAGAGSGAGPEAVRPTAAPTAPHEVPDEMVRTAAEGLMGLEVRRVIVNIWPEIERQVRAQVAAEQRAAAQEIETGSGEDLDPLAAAIYDGCERDPEVPAMRDDCRNFAIVAYRHLADRIAQGEPDGARLALVTADDLAEILDYVVGDGEVRVVRNETLDRAFAALKATLPRGEVR